MLYCTYTYYLLVYALCHLYFDLYLDIYIIQKHCSMYYIHTDIFDCLDFRQYYLCGITINIFKAKHMTHHTNMIIYTIFMTLFKHCAKEKVHDWLIRTLYALMYFLLVCMFLFNK